MLPITSTNMSTCVCKTTEEKTTTKVAKYPKICPTDDLKQLKTLEEIEAFLFEGNNRFGGFKPINRIAVKDGISWRLFEAQKMTPDLEGKLCNKTILLKSIVNQVNSATSAYMLQLSGPSIKEAKPVQGQPLPRLDAGAVDPVIIAEGAKSVHDQALYARLQKFVAYLNEYAPASAPAAAAAH